MMPGVHSLPTTKPHLVLKNRGDPDQVIERGGFANLERV
jgi:hypothetical protein